VGADAATEKGRSKANIHEEISVVSQQKQDSFGKYGLNDMDRIEQIFDIMKLSASSRFEQIQGGNEEYLKIQGDEIEAQFVFASQESFRQVSDLQETQDKGAVRYLVLSHLYSSIGAGGYSINLDILL